MKWPKEGSTHNSLSRTQTEMCLIRVLGCLKLLACIILICYNRKIDCISRDMAESEEEGGNRNGGSSQE